MHPKTIAILDFGSQYVQLIARRIREDHVHSVIVKPDVSAAQLRAENVVGLVWSGGPSSVYAPGAPRPLPEIIELGLPILGICYGMQLACDLMGGGVKATEAKEYGQAELSVIRQDALLAHVPVPTTVWMSHGDIVTELSPDFIRLAETRTCPCAVVRHRNKPVYGVQFHPEVTHTPCGSQIIRNFLYDICGCDGGWYVGHVTKDAISKIREQVGDKASVICGLSGGVDSSVTAALIHEAIGDRLKCFFIDNGLMRSGEVDLVEATFAQHFKMNLHVVDAAERFLAKLEGVRDPQEKRRIIGHEFIAVFQDEAKRFPDARFLAQGTLYPDVIESGQGVGGQSAKIKLHHNVGGLPADVGFELVEPLRDLFKDEVRRVGEHLGLPEEIVWRHPFPGPGLAVRIIGAVRKDLLSILRQADRIIIEEIHTAGWYRKIAQAFGVLVPVSTVGVMGDERSYEGQHLLAVRFVESADFMTADWVHVDYDLLGRVSTRIMNEVAGINRVVYDISSKPPSTIEWE